MVLAVGRILAFWMFYPVISVISSQSRSEAQRSFCAGKTSCPPSGEDASHRCALLDMR